MNKAQSKAAYTSKWLSRNRRFWHEEHYRGMPVIILDKKDTPTIVVKRVREINESRGWGNYCCTDEQKYYAKHPDDPEASIIKTCRKNMWK